MEGARCERYLGCLLDHGFENDGVNVALVDGSIASEAVHVFTAFDVPNVASFAAVESHRQGFVVLAEIRFVCCDVVLVCILNLS